MTRNSRRLQKAVQAIFNDYREKASCPGQVYQNAACGCDNALQMWRGPKGDKGDQGPQGPKGDNAGSFLVNAEFVVDPEGQEPGAYLKLVLIDVAQQEQVVYVDLSYLTDIYTGGNGISIMDMVVAARLGAGLTFDQQGNIASAYQFCDGLDETSNVVKVRLDSSNHILGFANGTCGGLTASVGLAPSATGTNLVLTGADGTVLSTVPLEGGTGITVQKNAQTGGFTWLADPAGLVSSQSGNQLSVSQTDNKLYVGGNTLSYTFGTGAFTLKDSSGATLSSVTVPSAVRMLEDMELRTDDGVYLHLTYLRDNGLRAYQDVSLDGLLCHDAETLNDSTVAYSKTVPSGNWQTASINEIGGKTVVWNQIIDASAIEIATTDSNQQNVGTFSGVSTHYYLISWTQSTTLTLNTRNTPLLTGDGTSIYYNSGYNANLQAGQYGWIVQPTTLATGTMTLKYWGHTPNVSYSVDDFMITDLTLMFGSGNEPSSVAEFEAMFPSIDPAYDTGTLKSAGVMEVVSEGRNLATYEGAASTTTSTIAVDFPTPVTFENLTVSFQCTGVNYAVGSSAIITYTTPTGNIYAVPGSMRKEDGINWSSTMPAYTGRAYNTKNNITITRIYIHAEASTRAQISGTISDIQIEASAIMTAYTPHFSRTLPIPAAVQALPGYGGSAGTAYNYVDFDRGVYVQNAGSMDLGTLDWTYESGTQRMSSGYISDLAKKGARLVQMVCPLYVTKDGGEAYDATWDKVIYNNANVNTIYITDHSYTDAAAFKAAMSGVMLYYELATPIETDISSLLTDSMIEVEAGGTLTFKNQLGDNFRLPVPNSETFVYEHPWVFEDCIKELVWKELEPYSSSIADVSASFSCGSDYTWYISALHPWCDTESDDCGGTVYSAPAVMPSLGTDIVMPAKILEKYSSVDIVISTAPISIITTDTSPTEFKYVTDAAHADAPYMAYELYSPYGAYYSFISDEEWAAASVGDLVELVSGRNVVEEHRAFKGVGNFDGSQLPPMQQCPLSDIPFRVFVVKETDSAIPDWPTGDIHIRVLQREGVEIPVTPTTLTLTTTDVSGTTHEQEIDMSCILDTVDDMIDEKIAPVQEQVTQNVSDIAALQAVVEGITTDYTYALGAAVSAYYDTRRTGKVYQVKFPEWDTAHTVAGKKLLDNAGLVCVPSTDTVEGQDDYADIPMFQWVNVNYARNADGSPYPTAIEGSNAYKTEGSVDVGVMQMSFYYRVHVENGYQYWTVSDSPHPELNLVPWPECVKADGTVLPWCIGSKYMAGRAPDGTPRSLPGLDLWNRDMSYNNAVTYFHRKGAGYQGAGMEAGLFNLLFMVIKYATKNLNTVMYGCLYYTYYGYVALAETDATRILLPANDARFLPNTYIQSGTSTVAKRDRGYADAYDVCDHAKILSVEQVTVSGVTYTALNIDKTVTTTLGGVVITTPFNAGATDSVLGHHDGSPVDNNSGHWPCRVQGREQFVGAWCLSCDVALNTATGLDQEIWWAPKGVTRSTNTTVIQDTYRNIGTAIGNNGTSFWIGEIDVYNGEGLWVPSKVGQSNSTGWCDHRWVSTGVGWREHLWGGHLYAGTLCGPCAWYANAALSDASWAYAARD